MGFLFFSLFNHLFCSKNRSFFEGQVVGVFEEVPLSFFSSYKNFNILEYHVVTHRKA